MILSALQLLIDLRQYTRDRHLAALNLIQFMARNLS